MKNFFIISFLLFFGINGFSQSEEEFKLCLKDSIQTALENYNDKNDLISIIIKNDGKILTQLTSCNDALGVPVCNECIGVTMVFMIRDQDEDERRNKFLSLPLSKDFFYVKGD